MNRYNQTLFGGADDLHEIRSMRLTFIYRYNLNMIIKIYMRITHVQKKSPLRPVY